MHISRKFLIIMLIVLIVAGCLLAANHYVQDLTQRLQSISPELSPFDDMVLDAICRLRDRLFSDLIHARLTILCATGL